MSASWFVAEAIALLGESDGRPPPSLGQSTSAGQLSENHCRARSYRVTCMSAPFSIAPSFFESPKSLQLNAVVFSPVASR